MFRSDLMYYYVCYLDDIMDVMDFYVKCEVFVCSVDDGRFSMVWYYISLLYRDSVCIIDGLDFEFLRNFFIDNLLLVFCCID